MQYQVLMYTMSMIITHAYLQHNYTFDKPNKIWVFQLLQTSTQVSTKTKTEKYMVSSCFNTKECTKTIYLLQLHRKHADIPPSPRCAPVWWMYPPQWRSAGQHHQHIISLQQLTTSLISHWTENRGFCQVPSLSLFDLVAVMWVRQCCEQSAIMCS